MDKPKAKKPVVPAAYKRKILDLEVEIAKLKVENKFYKNELELCKEEVNIFNGKNSTIINTTWRTIRSTTTTIFCKRCR